MNGVKIDLHLSKINLFCSYTSSKFPSFELYKPYFCSEMKAIRSGIALLLCGLFIYNSMGYLLVYSAMLSVRKQQAFAEIRQLQKQPVIAITLARTDKSKLENKKNRLEIKLNGCMYDVVRTETSGDNIIYYCVRDIREEHLIHQMNLLSKNNSGSNPLQKSASLIIDQVIKTALISTALHFGRFSTIIRYHTRLIPTYFSPVMAIPAPPPQCLPA